jgi:hypothetical protein
MAHEVATERPAGRSRGRIFAIHAEHAAVGGGLVGARFHGEDEDPVARQSGASSHAEPARGSSTHRSTAARDVSGTYSEGKAAETSWIGQAVGDRGRLDAERRGHAVPRAEDRPEPRRLLRHPGKRELVPAPLEIDRSGPEAEPENQTRTGRLDEALRAPARRSIRSPGGRRRAARGRE